MMGGLRRSCFVTLLLGRNLAVMAKGPVGRSGQQQVRHHRIMVRVRKGKFPALKHRQAGVRQNVVNPQRRGYIDVSTADAKAPRYIRILPIATDGEIGVRVGDIVKIAAYQGRVGAFIQLCPNLFGLVSPLAKGIAKLFGDGSGCRQDTVIDILDDLDVMEILGFEQDRLQVGRKHPYRVITHLYIGRNQAFGRPHPILQGIAHDKGVRKRVPGKDHNPSLIHAIQMAIILGKVVIRVAEPVADKGDVGILPPTVIEELLEANDIRVLFTDKVQHFGTMPGTTLFSGDELIKAAAIPGQHTQGMRRFFLLKMKMLAGMKSPKRMDIRPAQDQGHQRQKGPATAGREEKAKDKKGEHDKQQQGENQS